MQPVCRYCGSLSAELCFNTDDIFGTHWEYYQCKVCQAVYIHPFPSAEQFAQAYNDSYYGEKETKFNGPVERTIEYFRSRRAKFLALKLKDNAAVLDIGCGNGSFLANIKKHGSFRLYGIEPEGGSSRRAAKISGINLKTGILEKDDFTENTFDAITLFHVFEHLPEPQNTLGIIDSILKPDGLLIMSFPNIASWQARMFKGNWLHLDPPRHIFFFAPAVFVQLMKHRGYRLEKLCWMSTEQNPFGWTQSILNVLCRKRDVLFERMKGNESYAPEYGKGKMVFHKLFFAFSMPFFIFMDAIESLASKGATVQFVFRKSKS